MKFLENWAIIEKLLFFGLIPGILGAVYLIPQPIKDAHFILNRINFSLESLFLTNYVHSEFSHFLGNLVVYLIVIYLIMSLEKDKTKFYKITSLIFLLLPIILSAFTFKFLPQIAQSQGFSGIVAALIGYLAYALLTFLKIKWDIKVNKYFVYLIIMINLLIAFKSYAIPFWVLAILAMLGLILLYANSLGLHQLIKTLIEKAATMGSKPLQFGYAFIYCFFIFLFLFSLPALIEIMPQSGPVSNVLVHY